MKRLRFFMLAGQVGLNSLAGYIFARLLAHHIGVSAIKDAFDLAYGVPFIIMAVSGFSFIHGVVTSTFASLDSHSQDDRNVVFSSAINLVLGVSLVIATVAFIFAEPLTAVMAPGFSAETQALAVQLLRIMLFLVAALGLGTFVSAVLIAEGRPVAMDFCQIASRVGCIVWLLTQSGDFDPARVAWALVVFAMIGLLVELVVVLATTRLRYRPVLDLAHPSIRRMIKQATGMLVAAVFAQVAFLYMRRLASMDGAGTIAAMTYALSLVGPLATLIGQPLAATVGLQFAGAAAGGGANLPRLFAKTLAACVVVGVGVSVALSVFSEPLVALLYGGGAFTAEATVRTSGLMNVFIWSLLPQLIVWLLLMPLLSNKRAQVGAMVYCAGYAMQIVATPVLFNQMGSVGLAWGYNLSIITQAVIGLAFVIHHLRQPPMAAIAREAS